MSVSETNRLNQEQYSFDFSTAEDVGELVIVSQPPAMQLMIKNYYFQIGDQKITVFKNSITTVKLDVGEHQIKGGVKAFGIPATYKFNIHSGESVSLIFHGPLDMLTKGKFWQIEQQPI